METRYIYDAAGNLLTEADGSNNITKYYIHGAGLMAMVTPADQVYCYHFNAIGSTIATTDQSQNIMNAYSYDAFGNVVAQTEVQPQPFKFVGQHGVMTEPNGFYYMRARYYDPRVGRFISEDPIGFDGGINFYAYASNNPVLLIDPNGLCSSQIDWHTVLKSTSIGSSVASGYALTFPPPAGEIASIGFSALSVTATAIDNYFFSNNPVADNYLEVGKTVVQELITAAPVAKNTYGIVVDMGLEGLKNMRDNYWDISLKQTRR